MSIFSLMLLGTFCFYFYRKVDHITFLACVIKVLAGISLGLIYKVHYGGGDTFQYFNEAKTISDYIINHPARLIDIFFNTFQLKELSELLVFGGQPRALFFVKIVSIFYLLSGGNYWIIGAFLSVINFLGVHFLVSEICATFPGVKKAAIFSFYFLPTFVFWTSGLLKESLAIGALMFAVGIIIRFGRIKAFIDFKSWIALIISLDLLWQLKYFYAAVAIPVLCTVLIYKITIENLRWRYVLTGLVFLLCVFFVSNIHYNLNLNHVLDVVYQNYQLGIKDGNGIIFYGFDGSAFGFIINIPLALISGIFRPLIFETDNLIQIIVAIENSIIMVLFVIGFWRSHFKIRVKNVYVLAIILYSFSLAVLLAFASPNFGTLSRYKVAFWPFLVLLILNLFLETKKGQALRNLT